MRFEIADFSTALFDAGAADFNPLHVCGVGIAVETIRGRINLMALGHETGIAAALAAKKNIAPRNLDVKEFQRILLKEGFYLGDKARLKELGIA